MWQCASYSLECLTLQNIEETRLPFLVTLNPDHTPEHTLFKWSTSHPVPSVAASKASLELDHIQGKRGIWFCGAYQGEQFSSWKKKKNLLPPQIFLDNFSKAEFVFQYVKLQHLFTLQCSGLSCLGIIRLDSKLITSAFSFFFLIFQVMASMRMD